MGRGMKIFLGIFVVLVLGFLLVAGIAFSSYVGTKNQLVAKQQTVDAAWSEVDVQLQRRADLIPNLVETVKGFMSGNRPIPCVCRHQGYPRHSLSPEGPISDSPIQ